MSVHNIILIISIIVIIIHFSYNIKKFNKAFLPYLKEYFFDTSSSTIIQKIIRSLFLVSCIFYLSQYNVHFVLVFLYIFILGDIFYRKEKEDRGIWEIIKDHYLPATPGRFVIIMFVIMILTLIIIN